MLARLFKRVLDIERNAGLLAAGGVYGRPWTYQRGDFLGEQADDAGDGGTDPVGRKTQRAT